MSKSKGNVVTPQHSIEQYSADGVRYWAALAPLGFDTAYDEKAFKNGQKL
ncbi:MAG: class I tRNA ligase family protein, partial [Bdellovibrionales bacterium]|nr:class I tRNA ligase family protein [Bdellovibrionales bacterium]